MTKDTIIQITPHFSNLKNSTGKHKDWYGMDYIAIFLDEINPRDNFFKAPNFKKDFKKKLNSRSRA